MSDCDTCITAVDADWATWEDVQVVRARKEHQCEECGTVIRPGGWYERYTGMWDGEIGRHKTCALCVEVRTVFVCGGAWLFGCLWDDMEEVVFPVLTTANKCFEKLSPAAKAFVLDRWRKWKFRGATA
jgi:hypothetical protein